jgi:hypothetical protein
VFSAVPAGRIPAVSTRVNQAFAAQSQQAFGAQSVHAGGSAGASARRPLGEDLAWIALKDKTYGVWGVGKHVCPGRGLAYAIIGSALTTLLRRRSLRVTAAPRRWHPLVTAGIARPIGAFRVAWSSDDNARS